MTKKDASITFKTSKDFKEEIKELSELETRNISQTVEYYLKPVIRKRLSELKKGE